MIRLTTILWLTVVCGLGFATFKLKYQVQELEDQLVQLNKQVVTNQDALHVLKAEWSFLNQPTRLADLARRHLALTPIGPAQLGQLDTIAWKAVPPSESATTSTNPVAANPGKPLPAGPSKSAPAQIGPSVTPAQTTPAPPPKPAAGPTLAQAPSRTTP